MNQFKTGDVEMERISTLQTVESSIIPKNMSGLVFDTLVYIL